jgi:protoheme ferro-lyase
MSWIGPIVGTACFLVGYALNAHRVLSSEDSRATPPLTRKKGDGGKGHVAVIYFTHGEPPDYSPIGWINQFRELDETGVKFVPYLARPFFLYMLRKAYMRVGQSHHRAEHTQMVRSLERHFRAKGDHSTKFYLSFLDDEPRPEAALISALNDGASRVVVSEVFVTRSNHTKEGEDAVSQLRLSDYNVSIAFTEPLWNSETLHRMFLDKADKAVGNGDKANVGVLLVGHGQPVEWDECFSTCTEQEKLFMNRIIDLLAANGYVRDNLGTAWMSFREPKPKQQIEQMLAKGIDRLLFFAATISADSLHSQHDIPELVSEAKMPSHVSVTNLGAWNDHELAIRAIAERIEDLTRISSME